MHRLITTTHFLLGFTPIEAIELPLPTAPTGFFAAAPKLGTGFFAPLPLGVFSLIELAFFAPGFFGSAEAAPPTGLLRRSPS